MASSFDATLLPPPVPHDFLGDRGSARRLDDVGLETVMEAMLEKRVLALDLQDLPSMDDFEDTPRSHRVAADADAFLKAR